MIRKSPKRYIPSFVEIDHPVPKKKIFEGFYHVWAWRPSWSYDSDAMNKLLFPIKFDFDWPSGFGDVLAL